MLRCEPAQVCYTVVLSRLVSGICAVMQFVDFSNFVFGRSSTQMICYAANSFVSLNKYYNFLFKRTCVLN